MSTATEPVKTGNDALDRALSDLSEAKRNVETMRGEFETLRSQGATNDERLTKIADELAKLEGVQDQLRKIAAKVATADAPIDRGEATKREFKISNVVRALYRDINGRRDPWNDAGFEREVIDEAHRALQAQILAMPAEDRRAMGTVLDTKGGVLIPSVVLDGEFIELLKAQLVVARLGARVVPNLVGHRVQIPGIDSGVTAQWLTEDGDITASDLAFKARYLEPHRCAGLMKVSNNLLDWAPGMVEEIMRTELAEALAVEMERGYLFGSGADGEPTGLVNQTGINTVTLSGARFSVRNVPDFELELEQDNHRIGDDAGFVFHPKVKRLLKKEGVEQFTSQGVDAGQPYMVPGISDAALETLLGYRFGTTSHVPITLTPGTRTYVIFGLWRQLLIGLWGGMRLEASRVTGDSTGSALVKNQTWIVAERTSDALLRRPDAFVVSSDAASTA